MDSRATRPNDTRPRLQGAVETLERVQDLLQEIVASLAEEGGEDGGAPLRAVIECVLVDRLQPAVRDLRAAMD